MREREKRVGSDLQIYILIDFFLSRKTPVRKPSREKIPCIVNAGLNVRGRFHGFTLAADNWKFRKELEDTKKV